MPTRFIPVNPGTDFAQAMAVINNNFAQLDNEAVTKTFRQASGNAIIEGKLPYDGGYGFLLYDENGLASIIIGRDPYGNMVIAAAKQGTDIFTAYP